MLGFEELDVQPMTSSFFAVGFVPVSGLEYSLKNMEHGKNCPWHLSSIIVSTSERNFSPLPTLQVMIHDGLNVWMIDPPQSARVFPTICQSPLEQMTSMTGYSWRCGGHTCWDFQNGWCPRGRRSRWSRQAGILRFFMCGILMHSVVKFRSLGF